MYDELIEKLKTLKSQYEIIKKKSIPLKEESFLKISAKEYTLRNGEKIIRESISKGDIEGSASVIVPLTENYNIILVVQPRPNRIDGVGVELPAGYIDDKEEPEGAANRELSEETGYACDELIPLFKNGLYQDQGCYRARNHYFLATHCKKVSAQHLDVDEFITTIEVPIDEIERLIEDGYISDLNSIVALEKAKPLLKSLIEKSNKVIAGI